MNETPTIYKVIEDYITSRVPWDVAPFPSGSSGHMLILLKGFNRGTLAIAMEEAKKNPVKKLEIEEMLNPNSEVTHGELAALWKMFGDSFPMIMLGRTSGDVEIGTSLTIHYKQSILLDFSHPEFFSHLDSLLKHVIKHDDLSRFSLST